MKLSMVSELGCCRYQLGELIFFLGLAVDPNNHQTCTPRRCLLASETTGGKKRMLSEDLDRLRLAILQQHRALLASDTFRCPHSRPLPLALICKPKLV
jgi:hypothetical protein